MNWQDPSTDLENVNAAYRQQFERANAAEAELARLREMLCRARPLVSGGWVRVYFRLDEWRVLRDD